MTSSISPASFTPDISFTGMTTQERCEVATFGGEWIEGTIIVDSITEKWNESGQSTSSDDEKDRVCCLI